MLRIASIAVSLVALSAVAVSGQAPQLAGNTVQLRKASSDDQSLPSMNLWGLSHQLTSSENLQVALEVSPKQLDELSALLRSDSDLSRIILLKARLAKRRAIANEEDYSATEIREKVLQELDLVIRTRLSRILVPEQIAALRPFAMKEKYGDGYSAFSSREVCEHCGFVVGPKLTDIIKTEIAELRNSMSQAAQISAQRLVESLPQVAGIKFAYYLGAEKFPGVRISTNDMEELSSSKLPIPKHTGAIHGLAYFPELQAEIGITPTQVEKIIALNEAKRIEQSNLVVPPPPAGMDEYNRKYFAISRKYKELSHEVLTHSQLVTLDRKFAFSEYLADPVAPFMRHDFNAYLDLSSEELQTAMAAARQERFALQQEYTLFRKTCFMTISEGLEPSARDRLFNLFEGVFE